MADFLLVLVVIALVATFGVLMAGVLSMARSGEFNRRYGNILMRARVGTQGFTVLVVLLYFLLGRG